VPKTFCLRWVFVFVFVALLSWQANAQLWNDVVKAVGGVIDSSVHVVTAPTETVINAARAATGGAPASAIFNPYSDLGKAAGNTLPAAVNVANAPANFLYNQASQIASQTGNAGKFVFDVGTFQQNFVNQLTISGGSSVAAILRQENPLQLAAAPLAAALRAAHQRYANSAQPIPDDIKAGLAPFFPPDVLARAKYVVGQIEITLPNFIGRGARVFGQDYAVVVDDIIVFNTPPPSFANGKWWWGHETTHIRQYGQLGYEGFAWEYAKTFGSEIEGEANKMGDIVNAGRPNLTPSNNPALQSFGMLNVSVAGSTGTPNQVSEYFVAQCFFPAQPYLAYYMLTNTNRIIVVDPVSGRWAQIGWATPPRLPGIAWSFDTSNGRFAVTADGSILSPVGPNGQMQQVGTTILLYKPAVEMCQGGHYIEPGNKITWNLTFTPQALNGTRTDNQCSIAAVREEQGWKGHLRCLNNLYPMTLTPTNDCRSITSDAGWLQFVKD
jgi:hypothetical protein